MSQSEEAPEPFYVTVHGFEYQVIYSPNKFGGAISHFQFYHWNNGAESKAPCPLTPSGYRSHHFHPSIMDEFKTPEAGAIAAIECQQDIVRFLRDEAARQEADRAAAQFSLF